MAEMASASELARLEKDYELALNNNLAYYKATNKGTGTKYDFTNLENEYNGGSSTPTQFIYGGSSNING